MSSTPFPPRTLSTRGRDRVFQQVGDAHYRLSAPTLGIQLDASRLRRVRDELHCELTVICDIAGARTYGDDKLLSVGDLNFSSLDARWKRGRYLAERSEAPDVDWQGFLEELAQRVLFAERDGAPSRLLSVYEKPGADVEFEVDGWPLLKDHPVIAFGDGGAAKSYLALYVLGHLAKRGLNVLYADWELSGGDHRERLEKLFGPILPPVHYLRCDKALIFEADRLEREVRRLSIDYWVADSIAFATNGPPEAAEHAMAYMRAVRQIGIGSLHLAHVNRSETGDQKPFGSSFWHNSARATWFVKPADDDENDSSLTIGLFNKKSNLTKRHKEVGFEWTFGEDFTRVEKISLTDSPSLSKRLSIGDRVRHLLKKCPLSITQIAEKLEEKEESVKKAVSRGKRKGHEVFQSIPSADGGKLIALVERRYG